MLQGKVALAVGLISSFLTFSSFSSEPTKVMMMGVFHFANPKLDLVKTEQIDVTTKESQDYLIKLSKRIATDLKPQVVLIECPASEQVKIDQSYKDYLKGKYSLPVNEKYQIGFRVARNAKAKVICFDERNVEFKSDALMKELPSASQKIQKQFGNSITEVTKLSEDMHKTMNLQEIMIAYNQQNLADMNKSFYIKANAVGAGDTFSGADAAASWWHRNFRMFANLQKAADGEKAVLVIVGQGHAAIIKDFLKLDDNLKEVSTLSVL